MTLFVVLGLVIVFGVGFALWHHFHEKARNTQPLAIDFSEPLSLPYGECTFHESHQIRCRVFGNLAVTDAVIELFQFHAQKAGSYLLWHDIMSGFELEARKPLGARPFTAHLLPYYLNGALHVPAAHAGKNIVFLGSIWDSIKEKHVVLAVGPDRQGRIIEKTFGEDTRFDEHFVFAVYRPPVKVPHGVLAKPDSTTTVAA